MTICSYCKKSYKDPKGLTIFSFDGRAINYCSSKCRKNEALKREARKLNWVRKDKERMVAFGGISKKKASSTKPALKEEKVEAAA